ncbi:MAG: 6-phosphofructokinase [Peptococcaceae bacterium]|nr:6-phosphofructokinase [Peptococcaceae bacterium]MDH7524619.1 6-phosphofructokinase [Peptococcaceae bacterium]
MTLKGNCLIAQSGGPTAVINNSISGLIKEAMRYSQIKTIYGALFGIKGVLDEQLIDLGLESRQTIEGLRYTPGAALGSCRYKIKEEDYDTLLNIFKKHNIRYFFYVGGNDSMDTASKINRLALETGYEMRVIGVPKTVDNDLPHTDHSPGYGSAAKYIATVVKETGLDLQGIIASSDIAILEVMGRNAGWLTAAAALAKHHDEDAPHLIYLPEVAFNKERFISDVIKVYNKLGYCYVVASEGLKTEDGSYLAAEKTTDAFGHVKLGNGLANTLKDMITSEIKVKVRCNILGSSQRSAMHHAARVDASEAYMVGREAVKLAVRGLSGVMVTLERNDYPQYISKTGFVDLDLVANVEKTMPLSMINEDRNYVTYEFIRYAQPLIEGEVSVPMKKGVPDYVKLEGYKKLHALSRKKHVS